MFDVTTPQQLGDPIWYRTSYNYEHTTSGKSLEGVFLG
jgi:hypothetical protein